MKNTGLGLWLMTGIGRSVYYMLCRAEKALLTCVDGFTLADPWEAGQRPSVARHDVALGWVLASTVVEP